MKLELTAAELEFLAIECRLISNRKTLSGLGQKSMFLHAYDDSEQIPTVKLDENDCEDTLPGLGSLENEAEAWETLGEVPFQLTRIVPKGSRSNCSQCNRQTDGYGDCCTTMVR